MHELALAQAVVSSALKTAADEGMDRLTRIEIHVRELQSIKLATFEKCMTSVLPPSEPKLAGAKVDIEIEPAAFRCRACNHEFDMSKAGVDDAEEREAIHFIPALANAYIRCPSCDSPDFDVTAGRGVTIARLEGDRDD